MMRRIQPSHLRPLSKHKPLTDRLNPTIQSTSKEKLEGIKKKPTSKRHP